VQQVGGKDGKDMNAMQCLEVREKDRNDCERQKEAMGIVDCLTTRAARTVIEWTDPMSCAFAIKVNHFLSFVFIGLYLE